MNWSKLVYGFKTPFCSSFEEVSTSTFVEFLELERSLEFLLCYIGCFQNTSLAWTAGAGSIMKFYSLLLPLGWLATAMAAAIPSPAANTSSLATRATGYKSVTYFVNWVRMEHVDERKGVAASVIDSLTMRRQSMLATFSPRTWTLARLLTFSTLSPMSGRRLARCISATRTRIWKSITLTIPGATQETMSMAALSGSTL